MIEKALEFATQAHKGQVRKGTNLPYITHPITVADMVVKSNSHNDVVADTLYVVAILHDTLEDCEGVTYDVLEETFGRSIASYVSLLSKRLDDNYLDNILRIKTCDIATAVKIADLTHNMSDLQEGTQKDKYRLAKYLLEH
jgi:(p)ppGpp synthase/HD superfamily hydrolase